MGGGRAKFLRPTGSPFGKGIRSDVDLVEEWLKDKADKKMNAVYASSAEELRHVDLKNTDYLLGKESYFFNQSNSIERSVVNYV